MLIELHFCLFVCLLALGRVLPAKAAFRLVMQPTTILTSDPPSPTSRALESTHGFRHSCCRAGNHSQDLRHRLRSWGSFPGPHAQAAELGIIARTSRTSEYFANFVTSSDCDYISMSYAYSSPLPPTPSYNVIFHGFSYCLASVVHLEQRLSRAILFHPSWGRA